jgi:allophanate hydrolase
MWAIASAFIEYLRMISRVSAGRAGRMAEARFSVAFAGPHVSLQDGGRRGFMRFGVPASGPMDRKSFALANAALGNPLEAAGIEVSMIGLSLDCTQGAVTLAVAGGEFRIALGERALEAWCVATIAAGERLTIQPGPWGTWSYVVFAGHLSGAAWLGSLQSRFFAPVTLEALRSERFSLTDSYDRMGVRLRGPALPPVGAMSIPSAPISRGSIQVAGDGVPTVLLADHPTTGGYPKIATLLGDEVDDFVQHRPRDTVAFRIVSADEAVLRTRRRAEEEARFLARFAPVQSSTA